MRVLFDITHPAHVHIFRHVMGMLREEGHDVLVTARAKDVALDLLEQYDIPHRTLSTRRTGLLPMGRELLTRNLRLWRLVRREQPDVMLAETGVSIGPVGKLTGVPTVVFDQPDLATLQQSVGMPFATYICTDRRYRRNFGSRHVRFNGVLAQLYLDPQRWTPDPSPLRRAGVDPDSPYVVIRLVSWSATHDAGRVGLSTDELLQAIRRLERHGRVVISSEDPLPEPLRAYENPVPPRHFLDLLGLATLCVAEGGTVCVEAGLQGTPAICCNSYDFGYLQFLESHGLIRFTEHLDHALREAGDMLGREHLKAEWRRRADQYFQATDDVLGFVRRMIDRAATEHPAPAPPGRHAS